MSNIQQTSILAYQELSNLSQKRRLVYEAILNLGEACNLDIAYFLKRPINTITPRTNELVKLGLVTESKKDFSARTGKKVIYWRAI